MDACLGRGAPFFSGGSSHGDALYPTPKRISSKLKAHPDELAQDGLV